MSSYLASKNILLSIAILDDFKKIAILKKGIGIESQKTIQTS